MLEDILSVFKRILFIGFAENKTALSKDIGCDDTLKRRNDKTACIRGIDKNDIVLITARALAHVIAGIGYNAGSAAVIPYEEDGYVYINFKLKEKSILNKLIIHFPGTSAYSKEQQVSAYAVEVKDGDEWKRVAVRNVENSDNWDAYSDTAVFNSIETDEIRILFVNSKEQTEASIFEVELFADNRLRDDDSVIPELPEPQLPPIEPDVPNEEEQENSTNILKDSIEIKTNVDTTEINDTSRVPIDFNVSVDDWQEENIEN